MKLLQFKEIYKEVFADPADWSKWFFSKIGEDDIFIASDGSGRAVATLLMEEYAFLYGGWSLPSGYVSCVATRPEARSRGFASELMRQSLLEAKRRGYAFCELIPADDSLFFFYRRYGYATVFYIDQERYTALHSFESGSCVPVEPSYAIFSRLERAFGCGPVHSSEQYSAVLKDNAFETGHEVIAVRDAEGAEACLFATYPSSDPEGTVTVRSLLADNEGAASGALAELRRRVGERPFTVWGPPLSGLRQYLRARGMVRIVDPGAVLGALAASDPHLNMSVIVHDPDIEENNTGFIIRDGKCRMAGNIVGRPDLDVDIDVLASILFGSGKTGRIFNLPSRRPYMALMLD